MAIVLRDGICVLPNAITQVLLPRAVEGFAQDGSVRNANAKSAWLTVGLTAFMVLIVLVVSYSIDFLVPLAIPKYVDGIPLMNICLWFAVVQTASLPLNTLFATGRSWLYGRGVIAYLLTPTFGGVIAVAIGSLLGRTARIIVAYLEIFMLIRREAL